MDNRTYDAINGHMSHLQRLQEDNEQLRADLEMQQSTCRAAIEAWLSAHRQIHALRAELATANDNANELGKALDMCIAERDGAFAEVDAHRRELAAERNAHNATAAQLYAELATARAELDAMRQAHSVIAARMAAMGC